MESAIQNASDTKTNVKSSQPYKQFKSGMGSLVERAEEFDVEGAYEKVKASATDAYDTSVDFVKKHPVSTLVGATALGYLVGAFSRRK